MEKTQIIAETGQQELFIIREFDAPRELVFKAFITPEILRQFFAPAGVKMTFNQSDYRTGGAFHYTHTMPDGSSFSSFGYIHELTAPERIIQTFEFDGLPERGHVVLEAMLFEELPSSRTKLTIHDVCRTLADRNAMVESGMESGLVKIFQQLDVLLAADAF
jgi:uncharacterized protein YndB with AHSA1/START domain